MALDYWYDGQLRRYWLQFTRIFAGFQYETGVGADGTKTLRTIPVMMATKNRQVSWILKNNSENTTLSTPRISCEMTDIQLSPERRQVPNHVSTVNVWERAIDPATNKYNGELGHTYTVERYMAIPYDMTMKAYIWTSNEQQKHQFMEQVMVLFNPSIDLQTGVNPIDWTQLGYVELETVEWTNRDQPVGTEDDLEIAALTFKMPIWLTPPAKIKRQNIIQQIITNIGEINEEQPYQEGQYGGYVYSADDMYTRSIVTPGNHQARVEVLLDNVGVPYCEATLLSQEGHLTNEFGKPWDWRRLLLDYGKYRQGISQFRIKTNDNMDDHESDIYGIFDFHPTEPNKIIISVNGNSLPQNTLPAIDGMVSIVQPFPEGNDFHEGEKPMKVGRWPGDGVLPEASEGQRYLLASELPVDPLWTNVVASVNDIIEFDGEKWFVSFDASQTTSIKILTNNKSKKQLKWTGEMWVDAISADYMPGYWRVFL